MGLAELAFNVFVPRHAGLPARCGSSLQQNDAGVWLCEYPGLSFQRSPVCACLLVSSLLLSEATMSQQSSLTQSAHSVRQVLTAYIAATTPLLITSSRSTRAARSAASRRRPSASSNGVPPLSPSSAISRNITARAAITSPTQAATPSTPCSPPPAITSAASSRG